MGFAAITRYCRNGRLHSPVARTEHARRLWHRRLSVGWLLAKPWWRQKIMSEAMAVFLVYCFDHLDAHRIEARIEPGNIASMRLAKRLGFEREGLMRDCVFVGHQPRSQYLWALLCPNWHRRNSDHPGPGGHPRPTDARPAHFASNRPPIMAISRGPDCPTRRRFAAYLTIVTGLSLAVLARMRCGSGRSASTRAARRLPIRVLAMRRSTNSRVT